MEAFAAVPASVVQRLPKAKRIFGLSRSAAESTSGGRGFACKTAVVRVSDD
jgi:hypothetical protein